MADVVLIHDWLTGMRGGEKCLEVACRRWPTAPLRTLLHAPGTVSPIIENRPILASPLNRLPRVERYYRYLLPILPAVAQRHFRIPQAGLVLSFSHCVAKAATAPGQTAHVCYCFTPMRYAWDMRESYFGAARLGRIQGRAVEWLLARLRDWDRRTAQNVTHFIAISQTVQARIRACYGRDSVVIYPPVDTTFYTPADQHQPREDFYLVVSAFAPYKRIDLAIEACNRLKRRLVVIGAGQDGKRLAQLAGPSVQLLGKQPDAVIRDHYRRCRALLFPGEEDFGIVPVEAMACGAPVIALGRGGASETVAPLGQSASPAGVWFTEQNAEALIAAIEQFEANADRFDPLAIRTPTLRFNPKRFAADLFAFIEAARRQPLTGPGQPLERPRAA